MASDPVQELAKRLNRRRMMRIQQRLATRDTGDTAWAWLVLDELEWAEEQEELFEALLELAQNGNSWAQRLIDRYVQRNSSAGIRPPRTKDG